MIQWNQWNQRNQRSSGGLYVVSSATLTARSGSRFHHESSGMFINLVCFKLLKLFQWPNTLSQPYPLAPYGGTYASVPDQEPPHYFLTDSAPCLPGHPPLAQSTYSHISYDEPLNSEGRARETRRPSSRSRSMPSGSTLKGTRGYSSSRGRSKGKRKEQTSTLDSFSALELAGPLSLSQQSRSIPRSGSSRRGKPYDHPEQDIEEKSFNNVIWDLAKKWFILKLWRESCFFLKADDKNATVDRCATEAYEAAITEYSDSYESYPNAAALVSKYRLQQQETEALLKCREIVRFNINSNFSSLIIFTLVATCRSFVS